MKADKIIQWTIFFVALATLTVGTTITDQKITLTPTTDTGVNAGALQINNGNQNDTGLFVTSNNDAEQDQPLTNLWAQNAAFDQPVLQVHNDGVGNGIFIDQDANATAGTAALEIDSTSNNALALWVYTNMDAGQTGYVSFFECDNTGMDVPCVTIQQDGTAPAIKLATNATAMTCNAANEGGLYFNTGTNKHYGCDGTNWQALY